MKSHALGIEGWYPLSGDHAKQSALVSSPFRVLRRALMTSMLALPFCAAIETPTIAARAADFMRAGTSFENLNLFNTYRPTIFDTYRPSVFDSLHAHDLTAIPGSLSNAGEPLARWSLSSPYLGGGLPGGGARSGSSTGGSGPSGGNEGTAGWGPPGDGGKPPGGGWEGPRFSGPGGGSGGPGGGSGGGGPPPPPWSRWWPLVVAPTPCQQGDPDDCFFEAIKSDLDALEQVADALGDKDLADAADNAQKILEDDRPAVELLLDAVRYKITAPYRPTKKQQDAMYQEALAFGRYVNWVQTEWAPHQAVSDASYREPLTSYSEPTTRSREDEDHSTGYSPALRAEIDAPRGFASWTDNQGAHVITGCGSGCGKLGEAYREAEAASQGRDVYDSK
jgi:hypothetical protein